jgi:hypothetical protein
MAVTTATYDKDPEKRWWRRLRNGHEAFIKAGLREEHGNDDWRWLVGCTAVAYIQRLERAADPLLRPGESLFGQRGTIKRRGTRRDDLQINHLLGVQSIPEYDWGRARRVFCWENVSILPLRDNSAWDRRCKSLYLAAVRNGEIHPRRTLRPEVPWKLDPPQQPLVALA